MNFRNWPYYRYVLLFTLLALEFAELAPLVVSGVAPIHALLHGRLIADVFFCISLTSAVFVYLILVERRPGMFGLWLSWGCPWKSTSTTCV